ncbi:MAG: PAS domain-containing protein [Burkholderiales bacterium]|nr:PAS domain-containing protein [Burkholderiales bacterium]ODU66428.1 MAG: PAS domain-containing sensor histidine kinase [Lautropia sp. SCN 66-9]
MAQQAKPAVPMLAGLDLLASAVVVLDAQGNTVYLNQAAEQLFEVSQRIAVGHSFARLFTDGSAVDTLLLEGLARSFEEKRTDLTLERPGREPQTLLTMAVVLNGAPGALLLEFREHDKRWRVDREERLLDSAQANRELVRNLAHEIKNPLGGIRGAAQLLESELNSPALREYTQVIIKEADRLQILVDRLLAPHRRPRIMGDVNIHEVFERVRSVLLAEFPQGLEIRRDYDASLPEFRGDKEQLIQTVLNLARNAAQAMNGRGEILLKTRITRQATIAKRRWKLALDLHVIDNGPGVPEEIKDRIFFPLVSGRDGGSGLGLSLAQTFVQQHGGSIECESRPGRTDFRILLPLP